MNEWDKTKTYVTVNVAPALSGYFAHILKWYPEEGEDGEDIGLWDIADTGIGRYENRADAVLEAKELVADCDAIYVEQGVTDGTK